MGRAGLHVKDNEKLPKIDPYSQPWPSPKGRGGSVAGKPAPSYFQENIVIPELHPACAAFPANAGGRPAGLAADIRQEYASRSP